jgi:UDP-galactopyranose mutase
MIPFYPVKTKRNQDLYKKYTNISSKISNIYFSGRLGSFKYYDMDDTIESALNLYNKLS